MNKTRTEILTELPNHYAETLTTELRIAFVSELDVFWVVNSEVDLFIWKDYQNKYFLLRFI